MFKYISINYITLVLLKLSADITPNYLLESIESFFRESLYTRKASVYLPTIDINIVEIAIRINGFSKVLIVVSDNIIYLSFTHAAESVRITRRRKYFRHIFILTIYASKFYYLYIRISILPIVVTTHHINNVFMVFGCKPWFYS